MSEEWSSTTLQEISCSYSPFVDAGERFVPKEVLVITYISLEVDRVRAAGSWNGIKFDGNLEFTVWPISTPPSPRLLAAGLDS